MGFQRGLIKLEFADPDFSGLEVTSKRFSVAELLEVEDLGAELGVGKGSAELKEPLTALAAIFDRKIVGWNLEDEEGLPIPKTAEAILDLDLPFIYAILRGISRGSSGVSRPLGTPSSDGNPVLEESMPMELLS